MTAARPLFSATLRIVGPAEFIRRTAVRPAVIPLATPAGARPSSPWKMLYTMIWLAFAQILIAVPPLVTGLTDLVFLHVVLGLAILAVAHMDARRLKGMAVPDRVRRIARSTAQLASAQFVLGIYLFLALEAEPGWGLPGTDIVLFLHLVVALAIFSQASSTATAYDMWEEREFERVDVPAPKA